MHIIYLSGNSLNNRTWIESVKEKFDSFSTGEILYYDHWKTGKNWIDLDFEAKKLAELVKDKSDYYVFAKSIGSVLALKGIYEKTFNPIKAIFCGHPYRAALKENLVINNCLKTLKIPTIFIQNEFDPAYSFEELEKILDKNSPANYQLIENPGNETHDYLELDKLAEMTEEFFK